MNILKKINHFNDQVISFDVIILFFRIVVSVQLIVVHGLKKIGIGTDMAEKVPNPFLFPEDLNQILAIASNLVFPLFIIAGFYTRISTIPILIVTLSGYFVVHWHDSLLQSDVPFMYSVSFLLIAFAGSGKYSIDFRLK
ncbi:DoxX family protein [Flavobacterium sp. J27]|uniref:DoxX family protein n=1 Tax=Flavobacterium sp. J27 TaxID=2060419 RepID=UPI0010323AC0|nr:DoxX family protein [Flavobacterium sp. J27]